MKKEKTIERELKRKLITLIFEFLYVLFFIIMTVIVILK